MKNPFFSRQKVYPYRKKERRKIMIFWEGWKIYHILRPFLCSVDLFFVWPPHACCHKLLWCFTNRWNVLFFRFSLPSIIVLVFFFFLFHFSSWKFFSIFSVCWIHFCGKSFKGWIYFPFSLWLYRKKEKESYVITKLTRVFPDCVTFTNFLLLVFHHIYYYILPPLLTKCLHLSHSPLFPWTIQ